MKRVYLLVSLLLAISANVAMADQATVDALKAAGVDLTEAQATSLASAKGAELTQEISGLLPSCDGSAIARETTATILSVAAAAAPEQADAIMSLPASGGKECDKLNAGRNIGTLDVRSNNVSVSPSK